MAKRRSGQTLIQKSRSLSPQQKAIYHNVSGAGRSKVKRAFFDVSEDDIEAVSTFLETRLLASEQGSE